MLSLITPSKAQKKIAENLKQRRLNKNLTQEGLANRAGVSLGSLRKFEQQGLISLESFLKIAMVLDCLEEVITATEAVSREFTSIEDVLKTKKSKTPKRGQRT